MEVVNNRKKREPFGGFHLSHFGWSNTNAATIGGKKKEYMFTVVQMHDMIKRVYMAVRISHDQRCRDAL